MPKLASRLRAVRADGNHDRLDSSFNLVCRDTLSDESPPIRAHELRRRKRMQPPVVLCADEMQRAPIQPGDDERSRRREADIEVTGGSDTAPRAKRQTKASLVLCLDGEETANDLFDRGGFRFHEKLRRKTLGAQLPKRLRISHRVAIVAKATAVPSGWADARWE